MAFTRAHYKALADIVWRASTGNAAEPDLISYQSLVDQLCRFLREDNPRFDEGKFRAACLGKKV